MRRTAVVVTASPEVTPEVVPVTTYPRVDPPVLGSRVPLPLEATSYGSVRPRGAARTVMAVRTRLRTVVFGLVMGAVSMRSARSGDERR